MQLASLGVLNFKKGPTSTRALSSDILSPGFLPNCLVVDTCQRILVLGHAVSISHLGHLLPRAETHFGVNAYYFLLRFACGLESAMVGETDVFGQFKTAWRGYEQQHPILAADLMPWIHKITEDVKEIRSQYLQGIGGTSYGSLVRKLLKTSPNTSVLVCGAGQLAHSITPYLLDFNLWLYNRTGQKLFDLLTSLKTIKPNANITLIDNEYMGWNKANYVIVCTPLESRHHNLRLDAWKSNPNQGKLIHLGCRRTDVLVSADENFFTLDDLFDFQKTQDHVRQIQIEHAQKACEVRARLRSLGGPLHLSHGWEDLQVFV